MCLLSADLFRHGVVSGLLACDTLQFASGGKSRKTPDTKASSQEWQVREGLPASWLAWAGPLPNKTREMVKLDPLSLLLGAAVGVTSVLKFGTVRVDHPALLQSGWQPPALDAGALLALVEAKAAGTVNDTDFAARKAELFGCADAGCQTFQPPASEPVSSASAATPAGDYAYTWEDVALHSTPKDCWVGVHDEVYDFSCFWGEPDSEAFRPCYVHPGGLDVIREWCGKDGTAAFDNAGLSLSLSLSLCLSLCGSLSVSV